MLVVIICLRQLRCSTIGCDCFQQTFPRYLLLALVSFMSQSHKTALVVESSRQLPDMSKKNNIPGNGSLKKLQSFFLDSSIDYKAAYFSHDFWYFVCEAALALQMSLKIRQIKTTNQPILLKFTLVSFIIYCLIISYMHTMCFDETGDSTLPSTLSMAPLPLLALTLLCSF